MGTPSGTKRVRTAIYASSSTTRPCHMRSSFLIVRLLTGLLRCSWEERHLRWQSLIELACAPPSRSLAPGPGGRRFVHGFAAPPPGHSIRPLVPCWPPAQLSGRGARFQGITEAVLLGLVRSGQFFNKVCTAINVQQSSHASSPFALKS